MLLRGSRLRGDIPSKESLFGEMCRENSEGEIGDSVPVVLRGFEVWRSQIAGGTGRLNGTETVCLGHFCIIKFLKLGRRSR